MKCIEICKNCKNNFETNSCSQELCKECKIKKQQEKYKVLIENIDYVVCPICGDKFMAITFSHLKKHNLTMNKFKELYHNQQLFCEKYKIKIGKAITKRQTGIIKTQRKLIKCLNCTKEFEVLITSKIKYCCQVCYREHYHKNPHGKRGKFKRTKEMNENMSKLLTGRKNSKESNEKRSISMANAIMSGKHKAKDCWETGWFFSKINNREFYYRSSYELAAYIILDDEDAQSIIKSWKTEFIKIPYLLNCVVKHTVPDISVEYKSGKKQFVECKPQWKLDKDEKTKAKIAATQKYCDENNIIFSVWTEKELGITKERNKELLEIQEELKK